MKNILLILLLFVSGAASGQIVKTAGIPYTATTPAHTPSASGSLWAIDTGQLDLYVYYSGTWNLAGERIQSISGCSAPAYTPGKGQSLIVVNACDSLYYYRSSAWQHLNKGGGSTYYAGTGILISGDTIYNDGDLSATNEIQTIDTFEITSNTLRLSLSDDGVPFETVDLSPYLDNTDTSGYNLSAAVSNDTLFITDGDGTINAKFSAWDTDVNDDLDRVNDITDTLSTTEGWMDFSGTLTSGADAIDISAFRVNPTFERVAGFTTAKLYGQDLFADVTEATTRASELAAQKIKVISYADSISALYGQLMEVNEYSTVAQTNRVGQFVQMFDRSGTTGTKTITGGSFFASHSNGGRASSVTGLAASATNGQFTYGTSSATTNNTSTGNNAYAFIGTNTITGSGVSGTAYGLFLNSAQVSSGAWQNYYGIYIATPAATTARSLFSQGTAARMEHAGSAIFGSTGAPARTMHIAGEARITDLITDTPTVLVGADSDGDLNRIILGDNLSLSNDTLNATAGAGVTDLSFTGSSSPVTLNSSTGDDVTFEAGSNITLSQTGGTLTISASGGGGPDSTTARNTGATGEGIYSHEDANVLNFKKLIAGSNITLTPADSSITIAASGSSSPTVITPSTITADQDNYSPTDWATATIVRISGDSMIRAITGFASAGISDGHEKKIINVGSYPVYIPGEHPDSQDSNRVSVGYDYVIYPKATAWIMYDDTDNRWRITSQSDKINGRYVHYETSMGSSTSADWGDFGFGTSLGSVGNQSVSYTMPANFALTTASNAAGAAFAYFTKNSFTDYSWITAAHTYTDFYVMVSDTSDATNEYTVYLTIDPTGNNATLNNNSVGIRYTHSVNGGNWQGFSKNNSGTESVADLGVKVEAGVKYKLRVELNKSNDEVRFYINNNYAGRVSSNMPTATGVGNRALIKKSAGTTTRTLFLFNMSAGAIYP